MASANQLIALLKSHAEGDDERFYSVAMQLAAHEAKIGHGKLAEELRALVGAVTRPCPSGDLGASWPSCWGFPTPGTALARWYWMITWNTSSSA